MTFGGGGVCLSGLISSAPPSVLFPAAAPPDAILFVALSAMLPAHAALVVGRRSAGLRLVLAAGWTSVALWNLAGLLRFGPDATALVACAEGAVLALAHGWLAMPESGRASRGYDMALTVVAAVTLAIFGAVHLLNPVLISSLMPAWMPAKDSWPLLTGSVQLAAAIGLVLDRTRPLVGLATAAMFASWIPVVHVPRLLVRSNAFEWEFALMALCLAGAMLVTATISISAKNGREAWRLTVWTSRR